MVWGYCRSLTTNILAFDGNEPYHPFVCGTAFITELYRFAIYCIKWSSCIYNNSGNPEDLISDKTDIAVVAIS